MTFTKRPLRLGSGEKYHGTRSGNTLDLVFVLTDGTMKLKKIKKTDSGYSSFESTIPLIANEGVILGNEIVSIMGRTISNYKI